MKPFTSPQPTSGVSPMSLDEQHAILKRYCLMKFHLGDWHGVWDAAMDISRLEREMELASATPPPAPSPEWRDASLQKPYKPYEPALRAAGWAPATPTVNAGDTVTVGESVLPPEWRDANQPTPPPPPPNASITPNAACTSTCHVGQASQILEINSHPITCECAACELLKFPAWARAVYALHPIDCGCNICVLDRAVFNKARTSPQKLP